MNITDYFDYNSSGILTTGSSVQRSSQVVNNIANDLLSSSIQFGGNVTVVESSGISFEQSAFSAIEQSILRANNPIEFRDSEILTVVGQSGQWVNKDEIVNWRGILPIQQYLINEDSNPEVIRKKTEQQLIYEQEVAIRYLRPPTPPPPGEIIIRQDKNIPTPPAPPLVIRQQPPRPETPAPLIVREAPPRPPGAVGQKVITISGKRLPPPPRKVVIERLAPLPSKPQAIMVERWLPYSSQKRRVIFQKNEVPDPVIPKFKNVIIQWEAPDVQIKRTFKDLGVIRANPVEYVERYGASLKSHLEFPSIAKEIRPPVGVVLAAEWNAPSLIDLEGDIQALNLIDLDREGLGEYRAWLLKYLGGSSTSSTSVVQQQSFGVSIGQILNVVLAELFHSVDTSGDARISANEAENVVLKLNQRLGRSYSTQDAGAFLRSLDSNKDGFVDFKEFKSGLLAQFTGN
jgi:hypothetical protein